jgi:hypothetical protein
MIRTLLILALLFGASLAAPPSVRAESPLGVPVDGPTFRGTLAAAEAGGKLRFADAGKPHEILAADLTWWGALVEPVAGAQIILADGGTIVADGVRIDAEQVHGRSQSLGQFKLPLELVAGIILQPPADRATLDAWTARIAAASGQTDRLLLDNGDELTGSVAGLTEKIVPLESDSGKVEVGVDKVAAIIFNPTLVHKSRASGPRMLLGFADGSRLTAFELIADAAGARLKLAGGAELKAATDQIATLQPLGGKVVYLSDLKPISYRHVPYLQLEWPFYADRNVLGSRLRVGGRLFAKGLGMHSPSRITYDLDRPYRRFEAELAIDEEAADRGSVVFRVLVDDGRGAWSERATSEVIRGGAAPVPISVDLSGAKRLSLLVDYADRADELDHADWLNARLVR